MAVIRRIDAGVDPPLYYLSDICRKNIEWTYYRENLVSIDEENLTDYFVIDKIIDTRFSDGEEEFLVTFKNQTKQFRRWLTKAQIVKKTK